MTKTELIEGLANKLGMHKSEAEKAINIILDDIIVALRQGERVNI
jgi:nucleoid DNA-binding protein